MILQGSRLYGRSPDNMGNMTPLPSATIRFLSIERHDRATGCSASSDLIPSWSLTAYDWPAVEITS